MRRAIIVIGLLLSCAHRTGSASAQAPISVVIHNVEAEYLPTGDAYAVTAFLSVLDAAGEPISGLQAGDFEVREDGSSVEAFEVGPSTGGVRLVLVIDTSGSMGAEGKMNAVKEASAALLGELGQEDQAALVSFNESPKVEINLTPDLTAVRNFVSLLAPVGGSGTCLWDAGYEAVQIASAIELGRRAVILLTDGVDELPQGGPCSQKTLEDVVALATDATVRVPIFTVGVGNRVNVQDLTRVADLTGGRVSLAENASSVLELFDTLGDQLRGGYSLRYDSVAPSGEHNLFVQVDHGGARDQDSRRFRSAELPGQMALLGIPEGDRVTGDVTLAAEAAGGVSPALVEFYVDDRLLARDDAPPFEVSWLASESGPGKHSLRAVAYSSEGRVVALARSEVVREEEAAPPEIPTVLKVEGARQGQSLTKDATLSVTGEGPASIARVEFFLDGDRLAEDSSAPFEAVVSPSQGDPGQHRVEVVAFGSDGREIARETIGLVYARGLPVGLLAGAGLAALLCVVAIVVVATRRRRVTEAAPAVAAPPAAAVAPYVTMAPAVGEEVLGVLTIEECHDDTLLGQRFEIRGPEVSIGRSDACTVVIPIQPVSREHAVIRLREGQDAGMTMDVVLTGDPAAALAGIRQPFVIFDGLPEEGKRSTFGTYVDGVEVTAKEGIPLKDGCRIQLGRSVAEGHLGPIILRFQDLRGRDLASTETEPDVDAFATMAGESEPDIAEASTEGLPWEAGPTIMRGPKKPGGFETESYHVPQEMGAEEEGKTPGTGEDEPGQR